MAQFAVASIVHSVLDELRPRTLFDLANAIAVQVDGAVVMEDEHLQVVAYSSLDHEVDEARRSTILSRQIPASYVTQLDRAGVTEHLGGRADPVRFDGPDMLPRLAIALRKGDRTIGLLWVITSDAKEANARRVLVDVAPEVAVALERHLTTDLSRTSDRVAAAARLLEGAPVANLTELVGIGAGDGYVVFCVQPVDDGENEGRDPVGRTAQFAGVYSDAYRLPALVGPVSSSWVDVIVILGGPVNAVRAREVLHEMIDRASAAFGISLRGAMGTVVSDARGVPASRRDAVATLEALSDSTGNVTASYEERHTQIAVREIARNVRGSEHLTRGAVPHLLRSSDTADRLLVETVRAFLDSNGDVGHVATELKVHRNTIRNRIARFEVAAGVDLSNATDRLVVTLQLIR